MGRLPLLLEVTYVSGNKVNELGVCGALGQVDTGHLLQGLAPSVFPEVSDGVPHGSLYLGGGGLVLLCHIRIEHFGDEKYAVRVNDCLGDGRGEIPEAAQFAGEAQAAEQVLR